MSASKGAGTDKKPTIITGSVEPRFFSFAFFRSKKGLILLALLLVLLVGGFFAYTFWPEKEADKKAPVVPKMPAASTAPTEKQPLAKAEVTYTQLSDSELTTKVSYLIGTKQYTEAEKLITTQTDLNRNKVKLNLLLTVQQAQNKDAEASQTNTKIESLGDLRPGEYIRLGDQAKDAGNTAKAKDYYNKAIDVYNKEKQGNYQAEVRRVQEKIEELN